METGRNAHATRIARVIALATVLGLAVAACGRLSGSGAGSPSPSGSPSHTPGSGDRLLRVESAGGFIAPQALLFRYPTFSLFGDGTVITEGAQIDIYPQPSLPPLVATHLSQAGVQAVLGAAERAGLSGPDHVYRAVLMPDAPDTVFTLVVDGHAHTTTVTALGGVGGSGVPSDEARARTALQALSAQLMDLRSWLPAGSVGQDGSYVPTAMRIFVTPGAPKDQGGMLHQPDIAWPLATPLATFGRPIDTPVQGGPARCGVVEGSDLSTLLPKAQSSNQLSPWISEGKRFGLGFRPLLPDESGC
jgi:hypothetical protein